jgi:HD-like signal output (HDOD) protein
MNADKLKTIENIPELVSDISSLPVVASRILHIIADDTSSLEELKKVISLDQSFSSRVLRIANSAFYRRGRSIDDVTAAIMRIGFTTLKALVFATSLRDLCQMSNSTDRLLWEHNTAVSIGSTVIADETNLIAPGETLSYGLLHDIGKVLINITMRNKYADVVRIVKEQNSSFFEAEDKIFGFNHCDVGEYVANRWNLPDHLTFIIANHHGKDLLKTIEDSALKKIMFIVKASDHLCSTLSIGMSVAYGNSLNDEEWKFLKLSGSKKLDKVSKRIEEEYPQYKDFVMGVGT